jgi:hypothetical protein
MSAWNGYEYEGNTPACYNYNAQTSGEPEAEYVQAVALDPSWSQSKLFPPLCASSQPARCR